MKKRESQASISCLLMVLMMLISACATIVKVPIPITHPAEINMRQYKQIAISPEIRGNMGQLLADGLKNRLVESERFTVVDREKLSQIMKELHLSQSDLADSKKTIKLGKFLIASALIAGHIDGKYDEQKSSSTTTYYNKKDNKQYTFTQYNLRGIFTTSGSIDVIDVQTGKIIRSKLLNASCETTQSATNALPPSIDQNSLASKCLSENLNTFMKAIIPWKEIVQVPFVKDEALTELERGINQAKIGELEEAIRTFSDAAKTGESNSKVQASSIAKAYWNLGLSYEYSFECDKAIEAFKKAFILDPKNGYAIEINNAKKMKAEREKLADQNK